MMSLAKTRRILDLLGEGAATNFLESRKREVQEIAYLPHRPGQEGLPQEGIMRLSGIIVFLCMTHYEDPLSVHKKHSAG